LLTNLASCAKRKEMKLSVKKFPSHLKSLRRDMGLTQEQLKEKSGLRSTWISHFENGTRLPSLGNFVKLCNGLDVEPHNLLLP